MNSHTDTAPRTFLNKVISFLGIGVALYAIAGIYQWVSKDPILKHMVKCKYCRKRINEKVCDNQLGAMLNGNRSLYHTLTLPSRFAVLIARVGSTGGRSAYIELPCKITRRRYVRDGWISSVGLIRICHWPGRRIGWIAF